MRSFEELEKALTKGGYLKGFVDRILPPLVPERVLRARRSGSRAGRASGPRPTSRSSTSSTS